MSRDSPLDAALWMQLLEEGEVKCRGCGTMVDLGDAEDVNEAVELWNEHVSSCPEA